MQKLLVIDYWSQYTHLITSRFRHLEVFTEIIPANHDLNENDLEKLRKEIDSQKLKWIILSWWPNSVYDENTLTLPKAFFDLWVPILAICYWHQLTHHANWWKVERWETQEYWKAKLKIDKNSKLFKNFTDDEIVVWMSHWDEVVEIAENFKIIGSTSDCLAWATEKNHIFTLQFHPEVSHTQKWEQILENFAEICGIEKQWSMEKFLDFKLEELKKEIWKKNIFLFISGWVDSTVAYFLLNKTIWPDRIYPVFVDTGFMRKDEAKKVEELLQTAWVKNLKIINAKDDFLNDLKWISEPETKRKIIWNKFIEIQRNIVKEMNLDTTNWLLAQWTIYPDTIESGWTKNAKVIKTHHNRVPEIEEMIKKWLIIEPLKLLYKDEVRWIWRLLWIWSDLIDRHPFPWPWLSLRILCNDLDRAEIDFDFEEKEIQNFVWINFVVKILPVKSVWVEWDNRSYKHPVYLKQIKWSIDWEELNQISTNLTNNFSSINRVLLELWNENIITNIKNYKLQKWFLTEDRIELLQEIDDIVTKFLIEKWYQTKIWQFPVVLIPCWDNKNESIVLRPIDSIEAMTATFSKIEIQDLIALVLDISKNRKIESVFYDLTWKPPWTIEWE